MPRPVFQGLERGSRFPPGVIPAEHLADRVLLEEHLPAAGTARSVVAEHPSSARLLEGLDVIEGEGDKLVGRVQERYGIAPEKPEKQVEEWRRDAPTRVGKR